MLDIIDDDAAFNGCRPTFVTVDGRIARRMTADYGDVHPEVRLYDPELLFKSRPRFGAPLASRPIACSCGPTSSIRIFTGMPNPVD